MTSGQIRAARAMLRWSQSDLAEESGISVQTINRLESMDGIVEGNRGTLKTIARAFTDAGIELISKGESPEGDGPGLRLKE